MKPAGAGKGAILVIEDELSVLAFVRAALERSGYKVVAVHSGVMGLERLAAEEFAGVISDMRTPGGVDGQDVYEWLKQFQPALAARILFITGDIVNPQTVHTLRSSGVPFLEKPFRVSDFLEMVRKVIGTAHER